jgi:hypothetical protein
LALVAVFAVGEEQDGLVEMREAPLNVDHADNASIIFAGVAFAPSLPAIVGNLAAAHGGAIFGPLAQVAHG